MEPNAERGEIGDSVGTAERFGGGSRDVVHNVLLRFSGLDCLEHPAPATTQGPRHPVVVRHLHLPNPANYVNAMSVSRGLGMSKC